MPRSKFERLLTSHDVWLQERANPGESPDSLIESVQIQYELFDITVIAVRAKCFAGIEDIKPKVKILTFHPTVDGVPLMEVL